jgi:pyruvate/2-oxoglutarate dehydrogenase complex dihydrolipoamide acyltransferase (E2) component
VQETGKLAKWLVREGDYVEVGDLVCEVEVEKLNEELDLATMLIETHESGYVAR